MKKVELSLSTNYVNHWGVWEAVRELIQNAIDTGNYKIDLDSLGIKIDSFGGKISTQCLLLGYGTKTNDADAIGGFSEGMKLAFLVLCRMGKTFLIKNYDEVWEPKLEYSDTYNTECLVINIYQQEDCGCVSVEVELEHDEYLLVKENYVPKEEENNSVVRSVGMGYAMEKDEADRDSSRVYVNGLFVGEVDGKYKFDYNFKPAHVTLDRDRKTIKEFELQWNATQLITDSGNFELLSELSSSDYEDVKYYGSVTSYITDNEKDKLAEMAVKHFFDKYGEDSLPINRSWSTERKRLVTYKIMSIGKRPVEVEEGFYRMFNNYFKDIYQNVDKIVQFKPKEFIENFLHKYGRELKSKPRKYLEKTLHEINVMEGK